MSDPVLQRPSGNHDSAGADPGEEGLDALDFLILGPLEVRTATGSIALGGPKQRALLAALVLRAGEAVSTDRLAENLWGEDPPPTAPKMLQVFVSRLRRAMGEAGPRVLLTQPPGYMLKVDPAQVDLNRFEALVERARSTASTDPALGANLLREALALWRGEPLSDVALEPFAAAAIDRLEELRLGTVEERIAADLAAGRHATLIGELRGLVASHPLRERLRAQLMLALYRSGRQAEALEAFREARATLGEELGIDPGPELRQLEAAILRHDPDLASPPRVVTSEPPLPTERDAASEGAEPWAPSRLSRRNRMALAGSILAALVAVTLVALLLFDRSSGHAPKAASSRAVTVRPNTVAVLDARTGSVARDIPVGAGPGPIVAGEGAVWVGNANDRTLTKLDARSDAVVHTFGLPESPASLAVGDGAVWIGYSFNGTLSRVLVQYDQLSSPFFPGKPVAGLLAIGTGPDQLWVGLGNGSVIRLDPASLRLQATIRVSGHPFGVAVTPSAVWTIQFNDDLVTRIDPVRASVAATVSLPSSPQAIAAGDGAVWVTTGPDDHLWRIDPATNLDMSIPIGVSPTSVAVGPGAVWVGGADGILERVDPATNSLVQSIRLGHSIGGIATEGEQVLVTVR